MQTEWFPGSFVELTRRHATLLGRPIAQYEPPEPDLKQTLRSDPPQVVDSGSLLAASQRSAVSHKDLK